MILSKMKYVMADFLKKHPHRIAQIRRLAEYLSPEDTALFDYRVKSVPRWPPGIPHAELYRILDASRDQYIKYLEQLLLLKTCFLNIPVEKNGTAPDRPCWRNGWMPALDGAAVYGSIALQKPKRYMEVGSGNSTKFASAAVREHHIDAEIISIDPMPRTGIDELCTEVIRKPLEDCDLEIFSRLQANDVLYIDCSHRALMNSDATVFFLEVLPRLAEGVVVGIHDVMLPYDYPADWAGRWYSEQYLLACYLLAGWSRMEVLLPSYFVSCDNELSKIMGPLWGLPAMRGIETHGCSFWLRLRQQGAPH
ncbi:MAG: class I SAM-dependent methyltransferase [Kiritimatiellia bacterium]